MPTSTRRKTDNVLTMPSSGESPIAAGFTSEIDESDIARRAFERYCEGGCLDGHDVDDWLNAERELREAETSTAA